MGQAGAERAAEEIINFITLQLQDRLKRPVLESDLEVIEMILDRAISIRNAAQSGWY